MRVVTPAQIIVTTLLVAMVASMPLVAAEGKTAQLTHGERAVMQCSKHDAARARPQITSDV